MDNIIKDLLSIKNAGEEIAKFCSGVCPICGSEIYVVDGKTFFTCDCDKMCPVEVSNGY